jgi:hypothetical protein
VTGTRKPPQQVLELAEACVRFVKEALELELDYTQDTLPILDHYLRDRARDAEDGVFELVAPAAGAYFGEVVRRSMPGARWHAPDGDYQGHRVEFEPFFLAFNPIGVALEVLSGEDVADFGAHFQLLDDARALVESALESGGSVASEDYYSLSVRYEVLEQVADIVGALESQQKEKRSFGPEVYAAARGDRADEDQPN